MASSSIASASNYPYPSTLIPTCFVSIRLSDVSNYPQWEMQMLCLIESQELVGFIDGTILPPPEAILQNGGSTFEEYRMWKRSDRLVKGWILGSLGEQVLATMAADQLSTARNVWTSLRSTLGPHEENDDTKKVPNTASINTGDRFTVKLTSIGSNYETWREELYSILEKQDMYDFVFRPAPSEFDINSNEDGEEEIATYGAQNEDNVISRRKDLHLKECILASLNKDVLDTVKDKDLTTSRDVLTELEKTYMAPYNRKLSESTIPIENGYDCSEDTYVPLYKAARVGDWETAENFIKANKGSETALITSHNETLLHVVARYTHTHFLDKLVELLPKDAFMLTDDNDMTAIGIATSHGHIEATKIMVKRNPAQLSILDNTGSTPLLGALYYRAKKTVLYILDLSSVDDYAGEAATNILKAMITAEYTDIALDFVKRYPHAARLTPSRMDTSLLTAIASKNSYFQSGMRPKFLESFIYSCIPLECERSFDRPEDGDFDIENQANGSKTLVHRCWVPLIGVPFIKNIRQKKLLHHQSIQLVRCLCEGVKSSNKEMNFDEPITLAAELGNIEVVEEILNIHPDARNSVNKKTQSVAQLAAHNRCEKVFSFLIQMNRLDLSLANEDDSGKNVLDTVAELAPLQKLNLISGAALQMQRELQWFQEVDNLITPVAREKRNSANETAAMVFTRTHKQLVIEGEKWMKETATSFTIAAALIITVVFAAAITVPGGNKGDTGHPLFSNRTAFRLFGVSNAISFFTSTTSLLMFLSILTARYAEQDFLRALPRRLILGLLTLFLSITSMIIAFSATVYLVYGEKRWWIPIPLVALSCLPIISFVTLQFPLLIDVIFSTYGHGPFGKKKYRTSN